MSSEFLNGAPFYFPDLDPEKDTTFEILESYQKNQTSLERLDVKTCVDIYTEPIIPSHSDVLLVSTYSNFTSSLLIYHYRQQSSIFNDDFYPNVFKCSNVSDCQLSFANLSDLQNWLQNWLRYCLSVPAEDHCKLQFSLAIMIVIVACNLIKAVCMSTIVWKQDPTIVW